MREYARPSVVYEVRRPVADIRQISCLEHANDLLYDRLFHSRHLTGQAHLLGVRNPHVGVRVGNCAVRNDERTRVSQVNIRSGKDECVLHLSKYQAKVAICSYSKIWVEGLGVCFNFISKLVDRLKGGFATNESEVGSLKEGVFVINIDRHGIWRRWPTI